MPSRVDDATAIKFSEEFFLDFSGRIHGKMFANVPDRKKNTIQRLTIMFTHMQ